MKRLVIALCIIAALVGTNIYTTALLKDLANGILSDIEAMEKNIGVLEPEQLGEMGDALLERWLDTEHTLSRFVRHNELDAITSVVARLPSFARYDSRALLSADLEQTRILIYDLLDFESPRFLDIL